MKLCKTLLLIMAALLFAPLYAGAGADRTSAKPVENQCVILLHGLARSAGSMGVMAEALSEQGYRVVNQGYPSRKEPVERLASSAIPQAVTACDQHSPATAIHFVTHSMGGILVRQYLSQQQIDNLGRVVMLSPPNQGSETVDRLGDMPGFYLLNGPAGQQLGTTGDSLPNTLGKASFPLGIITGDRSINLILSALIPGPDDGKVAIERAKLEGMTDFLVVHHSHPFIMKQPLVIEQTLYFLKQGRFLKNAGGTTLEGGDGTRP
ncbi:MAG: alpha/beta fold hydrolase [Gammaproteobacteria bacterium]